MNYIKKFNQLNSLNEELLPYLSLNDDENKKLENGFLSERLVKIKEMIFADYKRNVDTPTNLIEGYFELRKLMEEIGHIRRKETIPFHEFTISSKENFGENLPKEIKDKISNIESKLFSNEIREDIQNLFNMLLYPERSNN